MQRLGAASFTMLPAAAPVQTRGYPGARLSVWARDWTLSMRVQQLVSRIPAYLYPEDLATRGNETGQ